MRGFRASLALAALVLPFGLRAQAPSGGLKNEGLTVTERKAAFRVLFNFDFRRTFVNAEPVRFYGFRIGAQRGRDVLALGFYGLGDPYLRTAVELDGLGARDMRTNFDYACVTYERLLVDGKRWQVGVPVSIGLGNYRTSFRDSGDVFRPYTTNELVPIEASLHVDYNLTWWVFLGLGGGYRHVLAAERDITVSLSDWTYYVKVGLRVGEMLKRLRKEMRDGDGA